MQLVCQNCGASLKLVDKTHAVCPYCGQTFLIDETTGFVIDFKIDYTDSVKTRKTIRGVKSTLILFFVVALFEVIILLAGNMSARRSEFTASDQQMQVEENGNLLRLFCKDIFGKEYEDITAEEFDSIKYIRYTTEQEEYQHYNTIYYSFTNYEDCDSEEEFLSTIECWTIDTEGVSWPSDFTMFTGLTRIEDRDNAGLINQEYSKEAHISYVETDSYLEAVSKKLRPADIKVLHIDNNVFQDSLDGMEAYVNLEELKIDIYPSTGDLDITGIRACSKLKTLYLDCGEISGGLEEIGELQSLESLYLNGVNLSNFEFLSGLSKLKELSVGIGENPDFAGLMNLHQLNKLIFLNEEMVTVSEIAKLENLTGLEELRIAADSKEALAVLVKLTNLKKLELKFDVDFSMRLDEETEPVDIGIFAAMEHLENFCFLTDDASVIAGVDLLLNMPQLKTLQVGEEYAGISFESSRILLDPNILQDNPAITKLHMAHCQFIDSATREQIGCDFLAHYPSIQVLNLDGCGIVDISFVENYQDLRMCSLRENEINDFSPLQACKKLEAVDIYDNPSEYHGLAEDVKVYNSYTDKIETDETTKYSD